MTQHETTDKGSSHKKEHSSHTHKHTCEACDHEKGGKGHHGDHTHLSELLAKVESLQQEAESFKEKYLRTYADLENSRKRMIREREEMIQNAFVNLTEDLLPIIDNFAMGLQSTKQATEDAAVISGFQIIYNQLESLLTNRGIERISPAANSPFNPLKHECVSHIAHDTIPEDHVVQTIRLGYQWKERLIRPATVVVSSGPANSSASKEPHS